MPVVDDRDVRQQAVMEWAKAAFGHHEATNIKQRATRLLEEALELFQAVECPKELAQKSVDVVYSRPPGHIRQEIGGVSITLLVLCEAVGIKARHAEIIEWERICSIPIEEFTKRNKEKNDLGLKP